MLKKLLNFCMALLTSVLLVACGSEDDSMKTADIPIPLGATPEDADYQSIQKQLKDAGFENVSTQKIEDLTFGILTKDGEVEKITVKGTDSFSKGDLFEKDVPITIHYHTFKNDDNSEESSSGESSSSLESSTSSSDEKTNTETSSTQSTVQTEILTPENPDFAYILSTYDEGKTKEFVEKYKGAIVEFDGHVAYVSPHGNYDTRFDYLVETGDWIGMDTSNYKGMPMKFENVNFNDLKFADDTDSLPLGHPIHIKAKITGVAKLGQLIYLEPVELRSR